MEAVLEQFRKEGYPVNEENKARLSPLIHEHINTQGRHSFVMPSTPLVARSVLALHLKRVFDNSGFPTTKPRGRALQEVRKKVVGVHVLLTYSPFCFTASFVRQMAL
jgi:hypothetical protein